MTTPVPEQSAPTGEPAAPALPPTVLPSPDPGAAGETPPKQHRRWSRRRTALLMGVAAVLGIVGGGGVGYAIQAQRPPTPLPPLAGDAAAYPAGRAAVPALSADQDDAVRTDGDLTKLLISAPAGSRPSGATVVPDGWLSQGDYARYFKRPDGEFRWLLDHGFRRAAQVSWSQGSRDVLVQLVQFQKTNEADVRTDLTDLQGYAGQDCGSNPVPVPDSGDGMVYPGTASRSYSDGTPFYVGCAYVRHGDLLLDVHIYDQNRVPAQAVMALVQSQLERL